MVLIDTLLRIFCSTLLVCMFLMVLESLLKVVMSFIRLFKKKVKPAKITN